MFRAPGGFRCVATAVALMMLGVACTPAPTSPQANAVPTSPPTVIAAATSAPAPPQPTAAPPPATTPPAPPPPTVTPDRASVPTIVPTPSPTAAPIALPRLSLQEAVQSVIARHGG